MNLSGVQVMCPTGPQEIGTVGSLYGIERLTAGGIDVDLVVPVGMADPWAGPCSLCPAHQVVGVYVEASGTILVYDPVGRHYVERDLHPDIVSAARRLAGLQWVEVQGCREFTTAVES